MLVATMNSKRQRRPNVRLGEIGDFSAALYCVDYHRHKQRLIKLWKQELENSKNTDVDASKGFLVQSSEQTVADPGVSSRDVIDTQQNRENRNPNSLKSTFDFGSSDEMTKPRLDFGIVTKKGRLMKRVKRGAKSSSGNSFGVGGAWSSRVYPEFDAGSGKDSEDNEFFDPMTAGGFGASAVNGLKNSFNFQTSDTSKEALENQWVEPVSDVGGQDDYDECWVEDDSNKSDALYYDNPQSSGEADKIEPGFAVNTVNSVREWLEELGFGMYAGLFELHEVDKEVLPLLTFEDLKDMGICTVGPRRKLYSAIQLLKAGDSV